MYILHVNIYAISFNRTQDLHFLKDSGKIVTTTPSRSQKSYHLAKEVYWMQNFVSLEMMMPIQFPATEFYFT